MKEIKKNKKMKDSWEITGKDKHRFSSELKELAEKTKTLEVKSSEMYLFTYEETNREEGYVIGTLHGPCGHKRKRITFEKLKAVDGNDLIIEELEKHKVLIIADNKCFLASKSFLKTFCQRVGSSCGAFDECDDLPVRYFRDAGYAEYAKAHPTTVTLMYREYGNVRKVFSAFSDRYKIIDQSLITEKMVNDFASEMGKIELDRFKMSNFNTEAFFSFKEKAEDFSETYKLPDPVIPGIHVRLSDTGDASLIVTGTVRIGGATTFLPDFYKRAHTKGADTEDILKEVSKRIFVEYTKIPDKLLELLEVDVQESRVEEALKEAVSFCKLSKTIGQKREKKLVSDLQGGVSPMSYTAYDLVVMILDQMEEIVKDIKDIRVSMDTRSAFLNILDFDFSKYAEGTEDSGLSLLFA